jgi:hypothetical protein
MHREERLPNYDQTHAVPDASFSHAIGVNQIEKEKML